MRGPLPKWNRRGCRQRFEERFTIERARQRVRHNVRVVKSRVQIPFPRREGLGDGQGFLETRHASIRRSAPVIQSV